MIRTHIQLTKSQMKALRRLSVASGKSIADLIRQSVDCFLVAQYSKQRIKRAMRVAGRFKSAGHDVSSRHDHYLSEAYDQHRH